MSVQNATVLVPLLKGDAMELSTYEYYCRVAIENFD